MLFVYINYIYIWNDELFAKFGKMTYTIECKRRFGSLSKWSSMNGWMIAIKLEIAQLVMDRWRERIKSSNRVEIRVWILVVHNSEAPFSTTPPMERNHLHCTIPIIWFMEPEKTRNPKKKIPKKTKKEALEASFMIREPFHWSRVD